MLSHGVSSSSLVHIIFLDQLNEDAIHNLRLGDGLRADLLFSTDAFPLIADAPKVVAPHLRSIVESRGAFGVSHTHVPTESRPGHVALIGMNSAASIGFQPEQFICARWHVRRRVCRNQGKVSSSIIHIMCRADLYNF